MELWDAYDKNLEKIDGMTLIRGEKSPEGVYHLVCDVIVRHTDGEYLLMQRDSRKHYGGMWEATAGGSALRGESPLECARRELREETGIHAEWLEELGRVRADGRNTVYCEFLCITDCKKDSIVLQEGETSDYRWVTRDELLSMKRDELVTQRMQMFIDELKSGIRSDADRGPYEPVSKEKMEFKKLTSSDTEWNALADYAENCSWGAGKTLAEEMRQKHFTGWERVILAEDQGRVAGCCTVSGTDCIPDVPYTPYIGMLFVGEEYRGKRLSQRMIDFASEYLKEVGFSEVYLVSDHENLYEKYGFQVIDEKMAPWGRMQKIYRRALPEKDHAGKDA